MSSGNLSVCRSRPCSGGAVASCCDRFLGLGAIADRPTRSLEKIRHFLTLVRQIQDF
ncbi:hypothetical protein [Oxynema aestuarii]|uniref:Uncharacterized protein n=1 Tax=Oxynema aestuarii AP17 TaxID=2064643 RepID=A0A6H1U0R6_9CYAN|nr:hypothetical protein [Oxynema aestuarii]QIZ72245.1 hypothetical protein HCG48_18055 [Oxynema aestuarii AP17]